MWSVIVGLSVWVVVTSKFLKQTMKDMDTLSRILADVKAVIPRDRYNSLRLIALASGAEVEKLRSDLRLTNYLHAQLVSVIGYRHVPESEPVPAHYEADSAKKAE
jgi:hypothetical protein